MKIIEYRIFVPMKLQMCEAASDYSITRQMKEFTSDGDGFEIVETKNYIENGQQNHYVYRILHCQNKIPSAVRWLVPEKYAHLHEYNTSAFPRYEGKFLIPAMGDDFLLQTLTNHIEYEKGKEIPDNTNNLTDDEMKQREIYYLDILDGPISKKKDLDLHGFTCPEIDMTELVSSNKTSNDKEIPSWVYNYTGKMTLIIKTVRINFKFYGAQSLVEKLIGNTWYQVFLDSHRSMIKWAPEWSKLTKDQIYKLENNAKDELKIIN